MAYHQLVAKIPTDLATEVRRLAEVEDRSISAVVRQALRRYVEAAKASS